MLIQNVQNLIENGPILIKNVSSKLSFNRNQIALLQSEPFSEKMKQILNLNLNQEKPIVIFRRKKSINIALKP